MIRFWISRGSSTPIAEQLSAQLLLGILSRKLAAGSRLPSVRDLARRLQIHPNTVSAAYADLAKRGWVDSRHGSGVFVARRRAGRADDGVDAFVAACVEDGRRLGYSVGELRVALDKLTTGERPRRLLVIDPDAELARVIAAELAEAMQHDVDSAGCVDSVRGMLAGAIVLASSGRAEEVRAFLGTTPIHTIQVRSMQDVIAGQQRPAAPVLVAVISRSSSILEWASTLLSALGFVADSVLLRNPQHTGWDQGLSVCGIIGADIVAARELAPEMPVMVFRVVDPESIAEVRALVTPEKVSQRGG